MYIGTQQVVHCRDSHVPFAMTYCLISKIMPLFFSKHNGQVTNSLKQCFELLPDWDYQIEIKKAVKIRSAEYNRLYWCIIEIMSQWSWYSPEDLHEVMKKEFIPKQYIKSKVDKRRKRLLKQSTIRLTTEEFWLYIEKVKELWKQFYNIDWVKFNL